MDANKTLEEILQTKKAEVLRILRGMPGTENAIPHKTHEKILENAPTQQPRPQAAREGTRDGAREGSEAATLKQ